MSEQKWTKEPWHWAEDKWNGGYSGLFDADDNPVVVPQCCNEGDSGAAWFNTDGDAGEETLTPADSSRIVACVNGSKGLNPEAFAECVELLGKAAGGMEIQEFAGAPFECRFCGSYSDRDTRAITHGKGCFALAAQTAIANARKASA